MHLQYIFIHASTSWTPSAPQSTLSQTSLYLADKPQNQTADKPQNQQTRQTQSSTEMYGRKIAAFAFRTITPYPKTPSTFGQSSSIPIHPHANSSNRCVICINDPSTTGSEIHKSSFCTEGKDQRDWFRWINLSTAHSAQRRRLHAAFA